MIEENPHRHVLELGHSMGAKKKKKVCTAFHLWLWDKTSVQTCLTRPPHDRTRLWQLCKRVCSGCLVASLEHSRQAFKSAGTTMW